jgi:hypothetical protein
VVNWPLRDGGIRAWLMLLMLGAGAALAGLIAQSGLMGGACFVALAIAGWRLWIPVTFQFRSKGVMYGVLGINRQIPWTRIARYEPRRDALLLFPDGDESRLAALRCLYIRWNDNRDAIMEVVEYYMQARVSLGSTMTFHRDNGGENVRES